MTPLGPGLWRPFLGAVGVFGLLLGAAHLLSTHLEAKRARLEAVAAEAKGRSVAEAEAAKKIENQAQAHQVVLVAQAERVAKLEREIASLKAVPAAGSAPPAIEIANGARELVHIETPLEAKKDELIEAQRARIAGLVEEVDLQRGRGDHYKAAWEASEARGNALSLALEAKTAAGKWQIVKWGFIGFGSGIGVGFLGGRIAR